ncbi:hypothetical protein ACN47E_000203 [Coniothyrium glycines]
MAKERGFGLPRLEQEASDTRMALGPLYRVLYRYAVPPLRQDQSICGGVFTSLVDHTILPTIGSFVCLGLIADQINTICVVLLWSDT